MLHHFHGGIVISQTDELNKYWRQYIPKQFIYNKYSMTALSYRRSLRGRRPL